MQLSIDPIFAEFGFPVHLGVLDFTVSVSETPADLLAAIEDGAALRQQELIGQAASSDPVIAAVRAAFKATGKDPSRYRPSSEALTRRALAGKGLYKVNNVVDSGNLVSLMSGLPVGCYDAAWIKGDLTLRPATPGETYEGIGRGGINLEGLPVLADDGGPFGSPYSDSARTAVTEKTENLVFVIYGLNVDVEHVNAAGDMADTLMQKFCTITPK
jgi:DNA/RNA-binding domain of Phe-tRNA-synthetase-like protein